MGVVYQVGQSVIHAYPEGEKAIVAALVEPGKRGVTRKMASLSVDEVAALIYKLDMIAMSVNHEGIAKMVAEELESIIDLVRMVKAETKADYAGMLGVGNSLNIEWLRPEQIGGSILDDKAAVGTTGPWQNGRDDWLASLTAGTDDYIIDEQTMAEEGGMIHLGAIDPVETPKIVAVQFKLSGVTAPPIICNWQGRRGFGEQSLPFVRWEKPVIVGPEVKAAIQCAPGTSGDTLMQLLTLLVTTANNTMTL